MEEELNIKDLVKSPSLTQDISHKISAIAFMEEFTNRKESPFWDGEAMSDLSSALKKNPYENRQFMRPSLTNDEFNS
jgi:hypothetical protein